MLLSFRHNVVDFDILYVVIEAGNCGIGRRHFINT